MGAIFAKLAPNIRRHPKCRKAGRDGTDVFIHVLCVNAERGATGVVPAAYVEPWFLADEIQMDEPAAAEGLRRAIAAELIELLEDGSALIVGWDEEEWGRSRDSQSMTEAERKRINREKKREEIRAEASKRPDKSKPVRTASGRPDYVEIEEEAEKRKMESGGPDKPAATPKTKVPKRSGMPDGFAPSDAHRAYAAERELDLGRELPRFVDHHTAKGSTFASWPAAFSTWLRNAVEFRARDGSRGSPPRSAPTTAASALPGIFDEIARLEAAERDATR